MHAYRTHTCGALRAANAGETVRVSGWVHRKRDHGDLVFIDLRDHYGMVQIVTEVDGPVFSVIESLKPESVVTITGKVEARAAEAVNANIPTGEIEIRAVEAVVQSAALELPLPVAGEQDYPEDIRLRYRFLDLRRETLHANIVKRTQVIAEMRARMVEAGFTEYSTPILTASSPEGARDFLVPSRIHPGKFYALPQAPQQYKQLLMVAGFDRYFQIAPCFRDEDARADRSPGEFYQLDLEMSFVTQDDVFNAVEPVIRGVFEEFGNGKPVTPKFPLIPYAAAIRSFGTDKPDLRNPLVMANVTDIFRDSGFKIFANQIANDPKFEVWAIPAPGGGNRAFCDRMNSWAQGEGQPGLGYIFWREGEEGGAGPIAKNLGPERTAELKKFFGTHASEHAKVAVGLPGEFIRKYADLRPNGFETGDAVFFVGGNPAKQYKFAGEARTRVAKELDLIDKDRFEFCWIVDFPMFEWNEEEKKIDFSHNPFSMPNYPVEDFLALDPNDKDTILSIMAIQYDIVCNGIELSSGAIRNHRPEVMKKAFAIAGYPEEVLKAKFGGMLHAFELGAPPHGGIAPGIDRIVMLLAGEENLREVVLFPMNQRAEDLLMGAPSEVTPKQLRELHIRLDLPKK